MGSSDRKRYIIYMMRITAVVSYNNTYMYMSDTMTHIFTFHGVTTQFEDYNLCVHVFTHTHTQF